MFDGAGIPGVLRCKGRDSTCVSLRLMTLHGIGVASPCPLVRSSQDDHPDRVSGARHPSLTPVLPVWPYDKAITRRRCITCGTSHRWHNVMLVAS